MFAKAHTRHYRQTPKKDLLQMAYWQLNSHVWRLLDDLMPQDWSMASFQRIDDEVDYCIKRLMRMERPLPPIGSFVDITIHPESYSEAGGSGWTGPVVDHFEDNSGFVLWDDSNIHFDWIKTLEIHSTNPVVR